MVCYGIVRIFSFGMFGFLCDHNDDWVYLYRFTRDWACKRKYIDILSVLLYAVKPFGHTN